MLISQQRRNPFKRGLGGLTPNNSPKTINNPLSHLTSKAVGFSETITPMDVAEEVAETPTENTENQPKNGPVIK